MAADAVSERAASIAITFIFIIFCFLVLNENKSGQSYNISANIPTGRPYNIVLFVQFFRFAGKRAVSNAYSPPPDMARKT